MFSNGFFRIAYFRGQVIKFIKEIKNKTPDSETMYPQVDTLIHYILYMDLTIISPPLPVFISKTHQILLQVLRSVVGYFTSSQS